MPVDAGPEEERAASKPNVGQSVPPGPARCVAVAVAATQSATAEMASRILIELEMDAAYPLRSPG